MGKVSVNSLSGWPEYYLKLRAKPMLEEATPHPRERPSIDPGQDGVEGAVGQ
jgi:hypothetical protein